MIKDFLVGVQKSSESAAIKSSSGRKNVLDLNILACIDVSGSVTEAMYAKCVAKLDAVRGLSRIKVIEIDTRIVAMYDFVKARDRSIVRITGGGGTSFGPAFALAEKIKPDAIVFLTDGMVDLAPVRDPMIPTGWVIVSSGITMPPYGFGEIIERIE